MIRLHVTAEGDAEKKFVKDVLTSHLAYFDVVADARAVLTSKDNRNKVEYRGGLISYAKAKADILTWLKEERGSECRFTTMFDLYALPKDFPSYAESLKIPDPYSRVNLLEEAMKSDINDHRFIPYIQLHEFEALILSDPKQLDSEYLEHDKPIARLVALATDQNPELIDGGRETAPSKRIRKEIPAYDKVTRGVSVAGKIGLDTMRNRCVHFNAWLTCLEKLAK